MTTPHDDEVHEHDLGLTHDLPTVLNRRRALGLLSAAGLVALAACGGGSDPSSATPSESGIVRQDLTSSFGGASGVAAGVPTTIDLTVVDLNSGSTTPYAGAAMYLWHCDREGRYSMYDNEIKDENYLRGVQVTDASGRLSFTSIFPAAYDGRWPHMHVEVYRDESSATSGSNKLRTSQLAIPEDARAAVYATSGYEDSAQNLQRTSLDSDMVFSDGYSLQLAEATGSVDEGYTLSLTIAV